jgi:hypothetical protein
MKNTKTPQPDNTVALSADGYKAIVVDGMAFVLYVYRPVQKKWVPTDLWDQEAAEMMRKLPTDPVYALKWANKASGVPYA